jgi:hypothetical protein
VLNPPVSFSAHDNLSVTIVEDPATGLLDIPQDPIFMLDWAYRIPEQRELKGSRETTFDIAKPRPRPV